jgi:hypothetical protein
LIIPPIPTSPLLFGLFVLRSIPLRSIRTTWRSTIAQSV